MLLLDQLDLLLLRARDSLAFLHYRMENMIEYLKNHFCLELGYPIPPIQVVLMVEMNLELYLKHLQKVHQRLLI